MGGPFRLLLTTRCADTAHVTTRGAKLRPLSKRVPSLDHETPQRDRKVGERGAEEMDLLEAGGRERGGISSREYAVEPHPHSIRIFMIRFRRVIATRKVPPGRSLERRFRSALTRSARGTYSSIADRRSDRNPPSRPATCREPARPPRGARSRPRPWPQSRLGNDRASPASSRSRGSICRRPRAHGRSTTPTASGARYHTPRRGSVGPAELDRAREKSPHTNTVGQEANQQGVVERSAARVKASNLVSA